MNSVKTITHLNFAKGFRGGERQTLLLIKELADRGYIQTILTRKNSILADRLKDVKNLTIIKIKKPYIFSLKEVKNSTLLHAHETKAAQFAYFSNLIFKTPYIITRRVDNPIKNNIFNKKIYENSNYTIALSKAIKEETLKISPNITTKIIPSAYSQFKVDKKEVTNIKNRFEGKFILGNIGELDNAHKGQYYLIEAMKELAKNYPKIHLILLGKGKDEQNYKNQAKELNNITFEGFVDNVRDYIEVFDIFVFPSLHEGLGSILFDVMLSQVPIIATSVGGIPDIIKDKKSGLLVPAKDKIALYKAIEKLYLDNKLREKLSDEASKDIENFSPNIMCDRYIKLYKEVL